MQRYLLLFVLAVFCALCAISQQTHDTVYLGSQDVKDMITRNNYVRVPESDLDEILERKISKEVANRLASSISIIASVLGTIALLFGGFIASRQKERSKSLAADLKKEIQEEVDKEMEKRFDSVQRENELRFINSNTTVKSSIDRLEEKVNVQIGDYLAKNFKEVIDPAIVKIQQEQQKIKDMRDEFMKHTNDILKTFYELKIERFQKSIEAKRDLQTTFEELKVLLDQVDKAKENDLVARVLEELSYASYYLKKDEEFENILSKYISRPEIDIKENTLVNVAVSTLYSYGTTRELEYRQKTLNYLNMALRKVGDYGEALGLKLELYMMDYHFADTPEAQEKAKKNAAQVLEDINSITTGIAAEETLRRLDRILDSKGKTKYIKMLFELFPQEMEAMRKLAETTAEANYAAK